MSEPKRQKIDPDSLEFSVSIKGQGPVAGISFAQFVDRKAVALAIEERLAKKEEDATHETNKKEERVLKLVQTIFPQAIGVDWEEEGGLEDVELAHYFYGSRLNLSEEFDMQYSLDVNIRFSTPGDPEGLENDSGIGLSFDGSLKADAGSDKVYFEFAQRRTFFHITNWQTDDINPSPEQVRAMLLQLVREEVGGLEGQYIREDIKDINMKKSMAACPRFLPESESE